MILFLAMAHAAEATCTQDRMVIGPEERTTTTGIVGTLKGVPSGAFCMGSMKGELDRYDEEGPQPRTVKAFQIMEGELTRATWKKLGLTTTPWGDQECKDKQGNLLTEAASGACPVTEVNWCQAVVAANKASDLDKLPRAYTYAGTDYALSSGDCNALAVTVRFKSTAPGYHLPTEAEWEWAARGGVYQRYSGSDDISAVGWIARDATSLRATRTKDHNAWGLFDMSGNVWEWVQDIYADELPATPTLNGARARVDRGGGWYNSPAFERVAIRGKQSPADAGNFLGFRLARAVTP